MEAFNKLLYVPAKQLRPGEAAARYTGPGGLRPVTPGALGYEDAPSAPVAGVSGTVAGGPSLAPDVAVQNKVAGALLKTAGPTAATRFALDNPDKVSDKDSYNLALMEARRFAFAKYPKSKDPMAEHFMQQQKEIAPIMAEITKSAPSRALVTNTLRDVKTVIAIESAAGRNPEEFMSWAQKSSLVPQRFLQEYQLLLGNKDPKNAKNESEKAKIYREQYAAELRRKLQTVYNDRGHEVGGAALNAAELERMRTELSTGVPLTGHVEFLEGRSRELQKPITENKSSLTGLQRWMIRNATNAGTSNTGTPFAGVRPQK
jgi:hypothetical protein